MALDVTPGGPAAESYASTSDFTTFLTKRGLTLRDAEGNEVTDTTAMEAALRNGATELRGYALRFPGQRANATQSLDWPRTNAKYRDSTPIPSDAIPLEVKVANMEAAFEIAANPDALRAVTGGQQVKREQAGSLVTELYESKDGGVPQSAFTGVEKTLTPLLLDPPTATSGTGSSRISGFIFSGDSP